MKTKPLLMSYQLGRWNVESFLIWRQRLEPMMSYAAELIHPVIPEVAAVFWL
jgi:hypothetical protein